MYATNNKVEIVEVKSVEYYEEKFVPFPLDKVKHILRKCTDDGNDCNDELYIVSIRILARVGSLHRECYLIIYCHLK